MSLEIDGIYRKFQRPQQFDHQIRCLRTAGNFDSFLGGTSRRVPLNAPLARNESVAASIFWNTHNNKGWTDHPVGAEQHRCKIVSGRALIALIYLAHIESEGIVYACLAGVLPSEQTLVVVLCRIIVPDRKLVAGST